MEIDVSNAGSTVAGMIIAICSANTNTENDHTGATIFGFSRYRATGTPGFAATEIGCGGRNCGNATTSVTMSSTANVANLRVTPSAGNVLCTFLIGASRRVAAFTWLI